FATLISRSIAAAPYRYQVRLGLTGSVREVRKRIPPWVGVLEPDGDHRSILTIGGDSYGAVTAYIVHAGGEFERVEPPEAAARIRDIARRLLRGTTGRRRKRGGIR